MRTSSSANDANSEPRRFHVASENTQSDFFPSEIQNTRKIFTSKNEQMSNRELEECEVHQRHQQHNNRKYNDDNHIDNRFNDDDDERVVSPPSVNMNNINENNAYTMNELQEKVDRLEKINNDLDNKKQNKNKIYSGDVVAIDIPSGEVDDVELGTTKKTR